MVTDRLLESQDKPLLADSLSKDEHHKDTTTPDFFYAPGTVCKVYEDEDGPICFVRCTKVLRLDIQYKDNEDKKRNLKAMISGFDSLEKKARDNGYTEIAFKTNSPLMKAFCTRRFGFVEECGACGELKKYLL
jgi:hypothetical protein